jgi:hypothetical protein
MIELSYLVSAWAGSPRDEHQLLGDLVSRLGGISALPDEHLVAGLSSSVTLTMDEDPGNRPREIWSSVGGSVKASFTLRATVAADTFDWQPEAPAVTRIEALAAPTPPRRVQAR